MSRRTNRPPHELECPPPRPRPRRSIRTLALILALLAATFVSVGSALADEEAPSVPEPATAMPDIEAPAAPEAPDLSSVPEPPAPVKPSTPELPEPDAPAPAPVETASSDAAPVDAAPVDTAPVDAAPVDAAPAPEASVTTDASVDAAVAPTESAPADDVEVDVAAPMRATLDTAEEPVIQPRVQVCPDPNVPGSYPSGGSCKVNICHATGSETNPYVFISPNVNSLNGHFSGNHQQSEDVIGVSSAADCPGGTTVDPCEAAPEGAYVNEQGQCVIDFCHATGAGTYTEHVGAPIESLNGHEGAAHEGDLIPMPLGGCPGGELVCEPPSFPQGGTCMVNICHLLGNGEYQFMTVAAQGLEGHGAPNHGPDIIGVSSAADCVSPEECEPPAYEDENGRCVVDICHANILPSLYWTAMTIPVSQLPTHQAHLLDVIPAPTQGCPPPFDFCPGPLNPGTQPLGTDCIVDACPGDLNPGNQPFGAVCIDDACPGLLNPGNQPAGTICIVDACPDALNPGNQAIGTVCIVPTPPLTPTPTPDVPTPTPAAPAPAIPAATPVVEPVPVVDPQVVEVTPEPEPPVVLGEEVSPEVVAAHSGGTLPFTGARTFGLTLLGIAAFLAGATLVRRRPRRTH